MLRRALVLMFVVSLGLAGVASAASYTFTALPAIGTDTQSFGLALNTVGGALEVAGRSVTTHPNWYNRGNGAIFNNAGVGTSITPDVANATYTTAEGIDTRRKRRGHRRYNEQRLRSVLPPRRQHLGRDSAHPQHRHGQHIRPGHQLRRPDRGRVGCHRRKPACRRLDLQRRELGRQRPGRQRLCLLRCRHQCQRRDLRPMDGHQRHRLPGCRDLDATIRPPQRG